MMAEQRLALLMQQGMLQAQYIGRTKTKCQLYPAATVIMPDVKTRGRNK